MRNALPIVALSWMCACTTSTAVSKIDLPDSAQYPGSIASAADGTVFVAGILGQIVKLPPSSQQAEVVVAQVGAPGSILASILIDDASLTLYACSDAFNGTAQNPFAAPDATLFAFDYDGNVKASYPLPNQGSSLCEEIAVDAAGAVYITDPFDGAIDLIAAPVTSSSTATQWTASTLFDADPSSPVPPFGAHGIAVVGTNAYVTNFSTSALLRFPIAADGTADIANIEQEHVAVTNPEKILPLDDSHLLVAEDVWCGSGTVAELTRSADDEDTWDATALESDILGANSVASANGSYYVVESQVCQIITQLAGGPMADPILPFWIDRIDAN